MKNKWFTILGWLFILLVGAFVCVSAFHLAPALGTSLALELLVKSLIIAGGTILIHQALHGLDRIY